MAERVPFFTLFESFQAPRQLRLLLHDACIISGALDMAGRTLEVQVEAVRHCPRRRRTPCSRCWRSSMICGRCCCISAAPASKRATAG